MKPWEVIIAEYGYAQNFMTPTLERCAWVRTPANGFSVAFELSSGTGMSGGRIYGVSVVRAYPWGTRRLFKLSGMAHSRQEADSYIRELTDRLGREASCLRI